MRPLVYLSCPLVPHIRSWPGCRLLSRGVSTGQPAGLMYNHLVNFFRISPTVLHALSSPPKHTSGEMLQGPPLWGVT